MDHKNIKIEDYLTSKGIKFFEENNNEVKAHCFFGNCDVDSKGKEAHLYIKKDEWLFDCKKCSEQGNYKKILDHFGDWNQKKVRNSKFNSELVEKCHSGLTEQLRTYLNQRGVSNEVIEKYKVGSGTFFGKEFITFPIKDLEGNYQFFKLRENPNTGNGKITYPSSKENSGNTKASLFGEIGTGKQFICEGEIDALSLISVGIPAATSSQGAGTFKKEWVQEFKECKQIYICFDNDDTGKISAKKVANLFYEAGFRNTFIVNLPSDVGEKGDINDYLTKLKLSVDDLCGKYSEIYPERIDPKQFQEMSVNDLSEILSLTIKKDHENKVSTFLSFLGTFSKDAQINLAFNAPSSTGKSYIPLETAKLFPKENLLTFGGASKTSFLHDKNAILDRQSKRYIIDLSNKIIILMDMPNYQFLEAIRSFLSRDTEEVIHKITDKTGRGKLEAKEMVLKGRPVFVYCSTNTFMDLQEMTRMLILSPEQTEDKIRESINNTFLQETESEEYQNLIDSNPERVLLKLRVEAIKQEMIEYIKFKKEDTEYIKNQFLSTKKNLQGRHNRDIKRLVSLIKCHCLLNMWFRETEGKNLLIDRKDIDAILPLWNKLTEGQDLNLPPYIFEIYNKVILPIFSNKKESLVGSEFGITRNEIKEKFYKEFNRPIADHDLRNNIIPVLKNSGLVYEEKHPTDKRTVLLYLISSENSKVENNSENLSGIVEESLEELSELLDNDQSEGSIF